MKFNEHLINFPNILNLLIILIPISFIFGNLLINIEIILISILGVFFYKKELFYFDDNYKLFFVAFFLFLILSTAIDAYYNYENSNLLKSFLFLRYLFLLLIVYLMVSKNHLNFRLFFSVCLLVTLIISLDIIYQFFNYQNILGFLKTRYHSPGVFDQEAIAGGYIQRFGVLGLFALPLIFQNHRTKLFLFSVITLTILISAILFSGNRMPFILILFFCFLCFFLFKLIRYPILISLFLSVLIFISTINLNEGYKNNYESFFSNTSALFKNVKEELEIDISTPKDFKSYREKGTAFGSGHAYIWASSIEIWKQKPITGSGIKTFRRKCISIFEFRNSVCESHPHNYYLDILNDTGLIGLIILIVPILYLLMNNFYHFRNNKNNIIFFALFFVMFLELFPLRSSGSFFSTSNASFIFLILGMLLGLQKKNKKT
ncbi:MAG: O-antigen ligase family protein [Pelagibacteraceae bacterium]